MNKRRNIIIILILIGISIILLFAFSKQESKAGSTVLITVNGEEYGRYPLGERREITIETGDGETNTLVIDSEGVEMISATCRDQKCVHQGKVTAQTVAKRALGNEIICLPHRIVISLTDLPISEEDLDIPDV